MSCGGLPIYVCFSLPPPFGGELSISLSYMYLELLTGVVYIYTVCVRRDPLRLYLRVVLSTSFFFLDLFGGFSSSSSVSARF